MQENKKRRNHHELDKCYAQIAKTLKTLNALGSLEIDSINQSQRTALLSRKKEGNLLCFFLVDSR